MKSHLCVFQHVCKAGAWREGTSNDIKERPDLLEEAIPVDLQYKEDVVSSDNEHSEDIKVSIDVGLSTDIAGSSLMVDTTHKFDDAQFEDAAETVPELAIEQIVPTKTYNETFEEEMAYCAIPSPNVLSQQPLRGLSVPTEDNPLVSISSVGHSVGHGAQRTGLPTDGWRILNPKARGIFKFFPPR